MTDQQIRAQWEEQLGQARARLQAAGARPGVVSVEAISGMDGLAVMRAILGGELPFAHFADTLDYALVEVDRGRAVFMGAPQLRHYNPLGSVHGGWYATLLDSALGCAVHTMLPPGRSYTTAELSVNIVRAADARTGVLRTSGTVIHCGSRLATAEGRIEGPDGRLYAHATTTCLVLDASSAGARRRPAAGTGARE